MRERNEARVTVHRAGGSDAEFRTTVVHRAA